MNCDSIKLVYFSPTNTTRKIVESIAEGLQADKVVHLDLTPPESVMQEFKEIRNELVIIGTPVYSGRLPLETIKRFGRLKGHQALAVVIILYGNREYEDALLELRNLAVELGFKPVAGGTFIGEHSYSCKGAPIAEGRPDEADLEKAKEFGRTIAKKVHDIRSLDDIPELEVPGNVPFKRRWIPRNESPVTHADFCIMCEKCVSVCPMAAITIADQVITNVSLCIMCQACVKNCPTGARVAESKRIKRVRKYLSDNYRERKEPEVFI